MRLIISFYFVLIISTILVSSAKAKKGCAKYGHSCLGGHGKRSLPVELYPLDTLNYGPDRSAEYVSQGQLYQEENPLILVQKLRKWIETHPIYVAERSYGYN